jgi:hypothetical protein
MTHLESNTSQQSSYSSLDYCVKLGGIPLSTIPEGEILITKKEDLKVGDRVYSFATQLTITSVEESTASATLREYKGTLCRLKFQTCPVKGPLWVNQGMDNKRGIQV